MLANESPLWIGDEQKAGAAGAAWGAQGWSTAGQDQVSLGKRPLQCRDRMSRQLHGRRRSRWQVERTRNGDTEQDSSISDYNLI